MTKEDYDVAKIYEDFYFGTDQYNVIFHKVLTEAIAEYRKRIEKQLLEEAASIPLFAFKVTENSSHSKVAPVFKAIAEDILNLRK